MEWFYAPELALGNLELPQSEAHHCLNVLRRQSGDEIAAVDGKGGRYQARIREAGKKRVLLEVLETKQETPSPAISLHIAISPTKNSARYEWFLEKATELGVSIITPLITHRSERRKGQHERWERVILAAMKQSGRSWLPELRSSLTLPDLISLPALSQRFIAHCAASSREPLWQLVQRSQDALLLIGPEGDFDPEEIALASRAGFIPVHLGHTRLRTETAGISALHILNLAQENAFSG